MTVELEAVEAAVWRALAAARRGDGDGNALVRGVMATVEGAVRDAVKAAVEGERAAVEAARMIRERAPQPAVVPDGERWCPACGQVKTLVTGFHRNGLGKGGFAARCRECVNRRRRELERGAAPTRGRRRWG